MISTYQFHFQGITGLPIGFQLKGVRDGEGAGFSARSSDNGAVQIQGGTITPNLPAVIHIWQDINHPAARVSIAANRSYSIELPLLDKWARRRLKEGPDISHHPFGKLGRIEGRYGLLHCKAVVPMEISQKKGKSFGSYESAYHIISSQGGNSEKSSAGPVLPGKVDRVDKLPSSLRKDIRTGLHPMSSMGLCQIRQVQLLFGRTAEQKKGQEKEREEVLRHLVVKTEGAIS